MLDSFPVLPFVSAVCVAMQMASVVFGSRLRPRLRLRQQVRRERGTAVAAMGGGRRDRRVDGLSRLSGRIVARVRPRSALRWRANPAALVARIVECGDRGGVRVDCAALVPIHRAKRASNRGDRARICEAARQRTAGRGGVRTGESGGRRLDEAAPAAHLTSPPRPRKNPAFVRFSASSIKPTVPSRPAVPARQRVAPPGVIGVGWIQGLANGK